MVRRFTCTLERVQSNALADNVAIPFLVTDAGGGAAARTTIDPRAKDILAAAERARSRLSQTGPATTKGAGAGTEAGNKPSACDPSVLRYLAEVLCLLPFVKEEEVLVVIFFVNKVLALHNGYESCKRRAWVRVLLGLLTEGSRLTTCCSGTWRTCGLRPVTVWLSYTALLGSRSRYPCSCRYVLLVEMHGVMFRLCQTVRQLNLLSPCRVTLRSKPFSRSSSSCQTRSVWRSSLR